MSETAGLLCCCVDAPGCPTLEFIEENCPSTVLFEIEDSFQLFLDGGCEGDTYFEVDGFQMTLVLQGSSPPVYQGTYSPPFVCVGSLCQDPEDDVMHLSMTATLGCIECEDGFFYSCRVIFTYSIEEACGQVIDTIFFTRKSAQAQTDMCVPNGMTLDQQEYIITGGDPCLIGPPFHPELPDVEWIRIFSI